VVTGLWVILQYTSAEIHDCPLVHCAGFPERYSHRILFVFFPLHYILCPCFLYIHIHDNYPSLHSPVHQRDQRAVAGLSVSFLFSCKYLPSLNYLHLCMSLFNSLICLFVKFGLYLLEFCGKL
jgi:hypothetical protein